MLLYCIIIWYLLGSVGTFYLVYLIQDEITVKDLLWNIASCSLGLIIFSMALYEYIKKKYNFNMTNFLDKKIIKKK